AIEKRAPGIRPVRRRVCDGHAGGEPGGEVEAWRGGRDVSGAQQCPVVAGQGNGERLLHCHDDVPYVYERAVLPERLPLRPGLSAPLRLDPLILARVPDPYRAQHYPGAFRGEEDRADHLVQQDSGTAPAVANCFPRSATISASAATLRSAATTTPPSKPPAGDSPKAALAS